MSGVGARPHELRKNPTSFRIVASPLNCYAFALLLLRMAL
jgi:hypothetical protein